MRLGFEEFILDLGTRELLRGGEAVSLSPKAFALLELLVRQRPNALSKEDLHRGLWPDSFVVDGNLANLVSELRTAFGEDAHQSRVIRTVQRFGYSFQAEARSLPASLARGKPGVAYRLLWGEREIALAEGENVIGRDETASVWVDDVSISRPHARIVIDGGGARLEDLGSKNGTYVSDRKITAVVELSDGDALRLGSVNLVFRRLDTGVSTATVTGKG
jgi:DNA-binding winged helix-turn-helix (wHTH) protein